MKRGFLVAAPHSGSGKTVITLGMMRALADLGETVQPYKAGPDFIDPAFHAFASCSQCYNLDPWGMRPDLIGSLAGRDGLTIVEGMMGLFDGAANGEGSCADLAVLLGLPVVFVVDCSRQSHSVAALVRGFRDHRPDVRLGALVLNRVSTARHERLLRDALEPLDIPVAGVVPPLESLKIPERHLGLVQAGEHEALEAFIAAAAQTMQSSLDLDLLRSLGGEERVSAGAARLIAPPGQRIAVARDQAFAFAYPHLLNGWREQGAGISFFSPLADEMPAANSDFIYLPGGYPELHAGRLAGASRFIASLHTACDNGAKIYGECGGYMVLGQALTDAQGTVHRMSELLPVETSFATPTRQLGYRHLRGAKDSMFPSHYRAHEFHYSTLQRQGAGVPLFHAFDALGADLGPHGVQIGTVAGSYMHLIDLDGNND